MLARSRQTQFLYVAAALFVCSLAIHLVPFFLHGPHPLGYDTGFYRRYLTQPLLSIPNTPVPGLGDDATVPRIILDLLRVTHAAPDFILYGTYLFFFSLLPAIMLLYLERFLPLWAAAAGSSFVALSSVLFTAFTYMLFKNAIAIDLILLTFLLLEKNRLWYAFALDCCLALTHTTTAIVYLMTLLVLLCMWRERRIELLGHGFVTASVFFLVNYARVHIATVVLPSALFLEWRDYLLYTTPLALIIIVGWKGIIFAKIPKTLLAFAAVTIVFPLLHLPFYERIFVFTDIALAGLAAFALFYVVTHIDIRQSSAAMYASMSLLCIAAGLMLGNLYSTEKNTAPLFDQKNIQSITETGHMVPENAYILTSANEAPWYEGWTLSHVIAPGLLYDKHNLEAWEALWQATSMAEKISFLRSFPRPLYISTTNDIHYLLGTPPPCVTTISPSLWYDDC